MRQCISLFLVLTFCFGDLTNIGLPIFNIKTAEAASGDFSIYRNNTDTTTVTSAGVDTTWDTTVSESANITLAGNNQDIDLAEGGKYLVLYNVWTEEGAGGGSNRRSLASHLEVNGTPLAYGRGAGYIRDSESDLTAYNAGAAIIDVSAGDDLNVHVTRDDTNSGASTAIRAGTNGVSVLKLDDDLDYLRVQRANTITDISGSTTFSDLAWDTSDEVDTGSFSFSPTSADITLKGGSDQFFLVTGNVRLENTDTSGQRQGYEMRLTLDGSEIAGSRTTTYIRFDNGTTFGTLTYSGVIKKTSTSDQTLQVEVRREGEAADSTSIVGGQTALSMVALPDNAEVLSLTNSGTAQTLSSSRTAFNWNDQILDANSYLSHSTSTNNSRITVDTAGDFIFFSTTYNSRTSGTNRDVARIEWQIDGITQSFGGHGSFNRGDQGSEDTYSGGSSGGVILPGLTSSQYVEVTHSDETTGTPSATYDAGRIAVQALEITSLTSATDVIVSVVNDQTATTSPDTVNTTLGSAIAVTENTSSRNVTSITVNESGTINANTDLENIRLFYDVDTSAPYDCVGESFAISDSQFGATTTFSGANGSAIFSDTVSISTTQSLCLYPVIDITTSAKDGDTINLSIDNPSTEVVVTSGGSVGPTSAILDGFSTTVRDAELTQYAYHWRGDDGSETTASSATGGSPNTPGLTFSTTTPQRLRLGVEAAGTGTTTASLRLEYAQKVTTCAAATGWTDVATGGDAWDLFDSSNLTDGTDTTDIAISAGGVSNQGSFITTNGGVRDTTSQTGSLTIADTSFVEVEFSLQATNNATEGVGYCFRVSDAGTPLRNYTTYAEAALSADVTLSATNTQTATVVAGTDDFELGADFILTNTEGTTSVESITITNTGTLAAEHTNDVRLRYDLDTSAPYDCVSEGYAGSDTLFGSIDTDGFSAASNTSTFTDAVTISTTSTMCLYVITDISSTSTNGNTLEIQVSNPSSDITLNSGNVGPGSAVALSGTTIVTAPTIEQAGYHWRNDDGSETDATSATGGIENSALSDVILGSTHRVRFSVANVGSSTASNQSYTLEYAPKISTCSLVGSWQEINTNSAFVMASTSNLTHGNNTTNISTTTGGVSESANTFISSNSGQRENTATTSTLTIAADAYTEYEFAILATDQLGYETDYCFRLNNDGADLNVYTQYAELTTQAKQDFFIQRGTETVSGNGITLTAGLDFTAPKSTSSAFIRITNTNMTGAGSDTLGQTRTPQQLTAYITGTSSLDSTVTIARPVGATDNTRVSWEIIEYIGVTGGDNEIVVHDTAVVSVGASNVVATGTSISGVTDDADIVPFITGQINPDTGNNNQNTGWFTSAWNATSSVPVFTRGDADSVVAEVSYAVVEFNGANWNIQRAEHTYTAAGVTETESITAIGAVSRAFLHVQKRSGDELFNLDETGHDVFISSVGAVSFTLQSGSTNPSNQVSVAWVIENTQTGDGAIKVYQSSGTITQTSGQPNIYNFDIGGTVTMSNASIWANVRSSGAGSAHPRAYLGARIISTTQYELWKSDEGQNQVFRVEVTDWPVAEISISQNYYRLYVDNDTLTPTDPWPAGGNDLGENTAITDLDSPLGTGDNIRIRTTMLINNASLPAVSKSFKLQYARRVTTCSAISSWDDVGAPGSGEIWRGYTGSPTDGTALSSFPASSTELLISVSDVAGTYEDQNNTAINPYTIDIGEDVEYDWHIENNGAVQKSSYCFRTANPDGSALDNYFNYPTLRTSGYTPVTHTWRWYDDETNETPLTPLADENTAPNTIGPTDIQKLRVDVSEIASAAGNNIKFNLEYSEYPDFSDGGTTLTATSSCVATSTWCYADGIDDDNDTITTGLLSTVDLCAIGVGDGCGTHNEAAGLTGTYNQPADSSSEHEFTIENRNARAGAVYYFRLYDATNGVPLLASSTYPSVITEGPTLNFTVSGLAASTVTEGITTDVDTTASGISFGSLPVNSDVEAAQRLSVTTNATEGYKILMSFDQNFIGSNGEINSISSTNASPNTWSTECTGGDLSCFGYHVGDDTLENNSARFAVDDTYAGIESNPVEVMYHPTPATSVSSDIVFKTLVRPLQPAGEYSTAITYIAIPVF